MSRGEGWLGLVGLVWFGLVWFGLVWFGLVRMIVVSIVSVLVSEDRSMEAVVLVVVGGLWLGAAVHWCVDIG